MDITQIMLTALAVLGVLLVAAMAILPTAMEVGAHRDEPRRPVLAPAPVRRVR